MKEIDDGKVEAEIARLKQVREEVVEEDALVQQMLSRNSRWLDLTAQIRRLEWVLQHAVIKQES